MRHCLRWLQPWSWFSPFRLASCFVYDIADFYKVRLTIPLAFEIASESTAHIENRARTACRERIRESKLLQQILPDIDHA